MKFPGYWVAEDGGKIIVTPDLFDETDLSEQSNWTEAWQNDDPDVPHGFIDPLAMLHAVCAKIADDQAPIEAAAYRVSTLQDLARLIQLTIPKRIAHKEGGDV